MGSVGKYLYIIEIPWFFAHTVIFICRWASASWEAVTIGNTTTVIHLKYYHFNSYIMCYICTKISLGMAATLFCKMQVLLTASQTIKEEALYTAVMTRAVPNVNSFRLIIRSVWIMGTFQRENIQWITTCVSLQGERGPTGETGERVSSAPLV